MDSALLVAVLVLAALAVVLLALLLRRSMRPPQEDGHGARLEALSAALRDDAEKLRTTLLDAQRAQREELSGTLVTQVTALSETLGTRLNELRAAVDNRLKDIQADNAQKLERMRETVDEKLQSTLEKRLGESFKLVGERLEQVHKGLGEMQSLAADVGGLKRVLSNVKTRGTWGEVQLAALLEQVLTPEQYQANVATRPGSAERVEFAIRLPGDDDEPVWLPIDAKFPREDYERLLDAVERADPDAVEAASKDLERTIRNEAKKIQEKYVEPPHTTNFAFLFLPTEGLYAEVLRRPGLVEALQRDARVVVAGPTTLLAQLNSLQMGFRTLAIQERSSEVWKVLSAVKSEFGKFGDVLDNVKKKLEQASSQIDQTGVRSRAIERRLRDVEALPASDARAMLPGEIDDAEGDEAP